MIELKIDEPTGIIKAVGTGRWSIADVDAFFEKLEPIVANFRALGRPIRFLSDVTGADIQSPEVEARINAHSLRLHQPGDRSAVVVKNSLYKAHARDAAVSPQAALFCSYSAAQTWLLAHDYQISA
ncbi:MAG: hypothetical protein ACO1NM_11945 [Sphingobium phenoxybenzoativorans]